VVVSFTAFAGVFKFLEIMGAFDPPAERVKGLQSSTESRGESPVFSKPHSGIREQSREPIVAEGQSELRPS
jgi:hypothetical protein